MALTAGILHTVVGFIIITLIIAFFFMVGGIFRIITAMTEHLKRFGNYQVNLKAIPPIPSQIRDLELFKLKTWTFYTYPDLTRN